MANMSKAVDNALQHLVSKADMEQWLEKVSMSEPVM
jgi:hypothetical protein